MWMYESGMLQMLVSAGLTAVRLIILLTCTQHMYRNDESRGAAAGCTHAARKDEQKGQSRDNVAFP